jgi:hypothetical protein
MQEIATPLAGLAMTFSDSASCSQHVQRIGGDEWIHATGAYSSPAKERIIAQFRASHA